MVIVLPLFVTAFYVYLDETYFIFVTTLIMCVLAIGLIICVTRHYQVFFKKH